MMGNLCHAEDITVRYSGMKAKVQQQTKDSVLVTVDGANVNIESLYKDHKITLLLTGQSDNGQLTLKTAGKAKVKLDNLTLTSQGGTRVSEEQEEGGGRGRERYQKPLAITACNDTANNKAATIWAKDKLLLSGKGTLHIGATGDGCRGIKTKKDVTIEELTLIVTTSGNNLVEKPFGFGGGFPPFGNDSIKPGGFPKPDFGGGFPPFGNDSTKSDFGGGFPGKHKYVASTKGIASKGKITINSGNVTVRTSTPGAEGIEGKEGIAFNGGRVDILSPDDAINANATIEFNGAEVIARSTGNDAVDANPAGGFFPPFGGNGDQAVEPVIIITGGTVYAWSQVGAPEEGLDCDFAPLAILNVVKDEPINIYDGEGKLIDSVTIPFSIRQSASIVSNPRFKVGGSYSVRTKDYERAFTISQQFTTVR